MNNKKTIGGKQITMYYPSFLKETEARKLLEREEENLKKSKEIMKVTYDDKVTLFIHEFSFNKNWTDLRGVHYAMPYEDLKALTNKNVRVLGELHEWSHFLSINLFCPTIKIEPPTFFLTEGLAVGIDALLDKDYEQFLYLVIEGLREINKLKSLAEVSSNDPVVYTHYLAGCFTVFLIKKYGIEKIKALYRHINKPKSFGSIFKKIYSKSFNRIEKEWMAYLRSRFPHESKRATYLVQASLKLEEYHPCFLKYERSWTSEGFTDSPSNIVKVEEYLYKTYFDLGICKCSALEFCYQEFIKVFDLFQTLLDKRQKCIQKFAKAKERIKGIKSHCDYKLILAELEKIYNLAFALNDNEILNRTRKYLKVINLIEKGANNRDIGKKEEKFNMAKNIINNGNNGDERNGSKV